MDYKSLIPIDISCNDKIVLPISMNQPLERGGHLKSILNAIEINGYKNQTTILVCDYLNRYNCKKEEEAIKQGEEFLQDHAAILVGYNVIRWKDFLAEKKEEFNKHIIEIYEKSQIGSRFYNKIRKTWEKCLSTDQSLDNSIKYQVEEYAAILCMHEFQHLFYPKKMTNAMVYLYSFIEGSKPKYHHIKISRVKNTFSQCDVKNETFFIGNIHSSKNHMHIAFRGLLEHIEILLKSAELSLKSKKLFVEEVENICMKHGIEYDKT